MPFRSQKQRAYFWKAKSDPKFRKSKGLNFSAVMSMTSHDMGGKLPKRSKKGK